MIKFAGLLVLILMMGCSTGFDGRGVFHRVERGEDLFWIAKSYGVDLQDLAEVNNIEKADASLTPGQKLYIPSRRTHRLKKLPFEGALTPHIQKKMKMAKTIPIAKVKEKKIITEHDRFLWPVLGEVISPFGVRHGRRHDGVDIRAKVGDPIKAAQSGRVVYASSMRGYGNLILIRHNNDFFTAYAHNKTNNVAKGDKIKQGAIIGTVGRTGRSSGPHLHFEVREAEKARNPLFFLPVLR